MVTQRIKQRSWSIWSWPYGYLVVCLNRRPRVETTLLRPCRPRRICSMESTSEKVKPLMAAFSGFLSNSWRVQRRNRMMTPSNDMFSFWNRDFENLVKIPEVLPWLENFLTVLWDERKGLTIPILARIRWISHATLPFHWQKTGIFHVPPCGSCRLWAQERSTRWAKRRMPFSAAEPGAGMPGSFRHLVVGQKFEPCPHAP